MEKKRDIHLITCMTKWGFPRYVKDDMAMSCEYYWVIFMCNLPQTLFIKENTNHDQSCYIPWYLKHLVIFCEIINYCKHISNYISYNNNLTELQLEGFLFWSLLTMETG